jgi:hypothetical protein
MTNQTMARVKDGTELEVLNQEISSSAVLIYDLWFKATRRPLPFSKYDTNLPFDDLLSDLLKVLMSHPYNKCPAFEHWRGG